MAWATGLPHKRNMFERARIKLTAFYLAGMIIVLTIFTTVLVVTLEKNIRETYREHIEPGEQYDQAVLDTNDGIETIIYVGDGFFLLILGIGSYMLAGRTLRPIREALDAQKRFSADASHDLRTPLTIITTESEVVLQDTHATERDLRRTIESNLEETKKMAKLVHDLLLISRGDNQTRAHMCTAVDAHDFIEKVVRKMEPQAKQKGLTLAFCPYKKMFVAVDKDSFERALSNILQNAIKYTTTGGIIVDLNEDIQNVYLTVTDTGVGIDPKDIPRVFDRFYKAEHSRNDTSSSGLGLSIAKLIIEDHRGTIQIKSAIGAGTEVVVSLPKTHKTM